MFDNMKKLMEMKKQADRLKKELEKTVIECDDVRGIFVKINGSQIVQSIDIDEDQLSPDNKNRFQTDLVRAINKAVLKSQKQAAQQMQSMGGFDIPGLS